MPRLVSGSIAVTIILGSLVSVVVLAEPSAAELSPADECEAAKLKVAGAYYNCREKEEVRAIKRGASPEYERCSTRFDEKWDAAETAGAGACPDEILTGPANAYLAAQAAEATSVIGGASIPACAPNFAMACDSLADCQSDCVASVRPPLSTGQSTCYDAEGTVIACAATGQDGELQNGAARSFTDNGDGTITDHTTGLMWEKLSNDDSIHDWNDTYTWAEAFATKVAALNSATFAGHSDWRLPNVTELETLRNFGTANPATYSVFATACPAACTVLTCSCTGVDELYWSSTTFHLNQPVAWTVSFYSGLVGTDFKSSPDGYVRAVRTGP